jgi:PAS domain S-box-containing protein
VQAGAHLERLLSLPGAPRSAGQARSFVRQLLEDAGHEEWMDAATLAVRELVTNGVIHGHTDLELTGRVEDDHVRVEVRDFNPTLPSPRSYDDHATTGRGLELVAAVSQAHGVESLGGAGKIVWFCVGTASQEQDPTGDELLAEWDDLGDFTGLDRGAQDETGAVTVVLRNMPATLWLAAREHHDALLRELALLRSADAESGWATSGDLAAADLARSWISRAVDAEVQRARESGAAHVPLPLYHPGALPPVPTALDLQVVVQREAVAAFGQLQDVLDEGERMARAGLLLVRPGLPEIVAVRDWAAEQVIAQVAGSPPAPWPGADDDRFSSAVDRSPGPAGWDAAQVTDAVGGAIAVDDGNRILAVSARLAEVLGWPVDELVGRRVVAIVPPRFREAHVAGFSRHLSTGDARALGVQLRLPVLRADGTELVCTFLIEAEPTPEGRIVYLASITPVGA